MPKTLHIITVQEKTFDFAFRKAMDEASKWMDKNGYDWDNCTWKEGFSDNYVVTFTGAHARHCPYGNDSGFEDPEFQFEINIEGEDE